MRNAPIRPPTQTIVAVVPPFSSSAARMPSFESGQKPMSAMVPIHMRPVVRGSAEASPPIRRTSCSPESAWITMPAPRKSSALKKAWVRRWYMPFEYAPIPTAANM